MIDIKHWYLENGIQVIHIPTKWAEHIVYFYFDVGNQNLTPDQAGYVHFLEHLMFHGTSRLGSLVPDKEREYTDKIHQILNKITPHTDINRVNQLRREAFLLEVEASKYYNTRDLGNVLRYFGDSLSNAYTYADKTVYVGLCIGDLFRDYLNLQLERFMDPMFRNFIAEQRVVLQEMYYREKPEEHILLDGLFGNHHFSMPIIGRFDTIIRATPEKLMKLYKHNYHAANLTIIVIGNIKDKDYQAISDIFQHFRSGTKSTLSYPEPTIQYKAKHFKVQTSPVLCIAWRQKSKTLLDRFLSYLISQSNLTHHLALELQARLDMVVSTFAPYNTNTIYLYYDNITKAEKAFSDVQQMIDAIRHSKAVMQTLHSEFYSLVSNYIMRFYKAMRSKLDNVDFFIEHVFNFCSPNEFQEVLDYVKGITPQDLVNRWHQLLSGDYTYMLFSPEGDEVHEFTYIEDDILDHEVQRIKYSYPEQMSLHAIDLMRRVQNRLTSKSINPNGFTKKNTYVCMGDLYIPNKVLDQLQVGDIIALANVPNLPFTYVQALNKIVKNAASKIGKFEVSFLNLNTQIQLINQTHASNVHEHLRELNELLNLISELSKNKFYFNNTIYPYVMSHIKHLLHQNDGVGRSSLLNHFLFATNYNDYMSHKAMKLSYDKFRLVVERMIQDLSVYLCLMHQDVYSKKLYKHFRKPRLGHQYVPLPFPPVSPQKYNSTNGIKDELVPQAPYSTMTRAYPLGRLSAVNAGLAQLIINYLAEHNYGVLTSYIRHQLGLTYNVGVFDLIINDHLFIVFEITTSTDGFESMLNNLNQFMQKQVSRISKKAYEFIIHDYRYIKSQNLGVYSTIPGSSFESALVHHDIKNSSLVYSPTYYACKLAELVTADDLRGYIETYLIRNRYSEVTVSGIKQIKRDTRT